jgi:hypothetical protein
MSPTVEERYRNDAVFHALVDMLTNVIHKAQFTPTEVREAALLACIHYEMYNNRAFVISKEEFEKMNIVVRGISEDNAMWKFEV